MRPLLLSLFIAAATLPAAAQSNPFIGRWDFDVPTPNGIGANWLGISAQNGGLEIWFQPTGGNVFQVKDYKLSGTHLTLNISPQTARRPALVWELDAAGGKLTGTQKRGANTISLTGVRAPALNRPAPAAWSAP